MVVALAQAVVDRLKGWVTDSVLPTEVAGLPAMEVLQDLVVTNENTKEDRIAMPNGEGTEQATQTKRFEAWVVCFLLFFFLWDTTVLQLVHTVYF